MYIPVLLKKSQLYQPLRMLALKMVGRNPLCTIRSAVKGRQNRLSWEEIKPQLANASRLVERDPGGFNLWETPKGRFWMPAATQGDYLFWMLAEQEVGVYGMPEHRVRTGDIVLDGGTNVGVFTRAALAAGAKQVVAIEPAPENLECLRRNLAKEIADGRVLVYAKGLWDQDGTLPLFIDSDSSTANTFITQDGQYSEGPKVELTTIDKLVAKLELEQIDFIKLDIEGAEQRAITGAKITLAKFKPRLAIGVEHNTPSPLENAKQVWKIVRRAQPRYQMECTFCTEDDYFVVPLALCFH